MIRTEYFAETNETVEVELTKEEIAEVKARALEAEKEKAKEEAEAKAKAEAKAVLLERLGITEVEAKLLLS
jgi:hypothetical protein